MVTEVENVNLRTPLVVDSPLRRSTAEGAEERGVVIFSDTSVWETGQKLATSCRLRPFSKAFREVPWAACPCHFNRACIPSMKSRTQVIAAAIEVHKKFGPGAARVRLQRTPWELNSLPRGLDVHISKPVSLEHEGLHITPGLRHRSSGGGEGDRRGQVRPEAHRDRFRTNVLTYLRLMDLRVGLLINFNVTLLKHGIRRVVNRHVDEEGNKLRVSTGRESVAEVKRADRFRSAKLQ